MARFTSYTRKNTPADSDVILIADSADSSENKTVLLGGLWSWLTNKFSSATIGALNTTSKTVIGAINEASQVDTNLNTAGKAADAGAVGDALALKADANAVYTKAQVDNLLPTIDDELDDNSTNPIQNKVVAGEITELRADLGSFKETGGADKYFTNVKVYGSPASIGISNIRNNYGPADAKQTGFAIFPATTDTEWGSAIKNVTNAAVSGHFKETLSDGRTYEFDYDLSSLASGTRDIVRDAAHVIKKTRFYDVPVVPWFYIDEEGYMCQEVTEVE